MDIKKLGNFITLYSKKIKQSKLNRALDIKNVHIQTIPQCIVEREKNMQAVDIRKVIEEQYSEMVEIFETTVKEKMPHVNLSAFYRNIQTLKFVKENSLVHSLRNIVAYCTYNEDKNEYIIRFLNGKIIESIFHELLHIATWREKGKICYLGFQQSNFNDDKFFVIGSGLNEGYTTVLSIRYFPDYEEDSCSYVPLAYISEKIEDIVGRKKMETLYFNSALNELVTILSKYDTEENIILFLKQIDFIKQNCGNLRLEQLIHDVYKDIITKLYNWVIAVLIESIKIGYNSTKEVLNFLDYYLYELDQQYKYNQINYKAFTDEEIEELIKEAKSQIKALNNTPSAI